MRVFCITDIHGNRDGMAALFKQKEPFMGIDLIAFVGDVTHFGGYDDARTILEPALQSGYRLLAIPGNHDKQGVADFLDEKGINLHARGLVIGNTGFLGLGGSNRTPFSTPNEYSEEQLAAFLEKGFPAIAACEVKVLISHVPPKDTPLDRITAGPHVGSASVKNFILEKKIDFCLCGHIHEAAGFCKVAQTHCINSGAFHEGKYQCIELGPEGLKIIRSNL